MIAQSNVNPSHDWSWARLEITVKEMEGKKKNKKGKKSEEKGHVKAAGAADAKTLGRLHSEAYRIFSTPPLQNPSGNFFFFLKKKILIAFSSPFF